jgi:hypothetical protein
LSIYFILHLFFYLFSNLFIGIGKSYKQKTKTKRALHSAKPDTGADADMFGSASGIRSLGGAGRGTGARGFSLLELCKDHLAPWLHAFHSIALKRYWRKNYYISVLSNRNRVGRINMMIFMM